MKIERNLAATVKPISRQDEERWQREAAKVDELNAKEVARKPGEPRPYHPFALQGGGIE